MNAYARPMPEPTAESKPYWDGLKARRLVLQHCAACGRVRHYPRPVCPHCHSMETRWQDVAGDGAVHSWTVCHHAFHPGFKDAVPYVAVTVDLPCGVRMQAPLRGVDASGLRIGLAVRLGFEDATPELTLPFFVPA